MRLFCYKTIVVLLIALITSIRKFRTKRNIYQDPYFNTVMELFLCFDIFVYCITVQYAAHCFIAYCQAKQFNCSQFSYLSVIKTALNSIISLF